MMMTVFGDAVANMHLIGKSPDFTTQTQKNGKRTQRRTKTPSPTVWTGHWTRTERTEPLFSSQPWGPLRSYWEPPCFLLWPPLWWRRQRCLVLATRGSPRIKKPPPPPVLHREVAMENSSSKPLLSGLKVLYRAKFTFSVFSNNTLCL